MTDHNLMNPDVEELPEGPALDLMLPPEIGSWKLLEPDVQPVNTVLLHKLTAEGKPFVEICLSANMEYVLLFTTKPHPVDDRVKATYVLPLRLALRYAILQLFGVDFEKAAPTGESDAPLS